MAFVLSPLLSLMLVMPTAMLTHWHTVNTPAPGTPRILGSYTAGCIQGAVALAPAGEGFVTLRRSRRRFFGHPQLVDYLENLGRLAVAHGLGVLLLGDLGQPRGGPTPSGHRSHQNGLDVDIWFRLADPQAIPSAAERETIRLPSMLTATRQELAPQHWSPQHVQLLQLAAAPQQVERIFINPVIKQALCKQFPGAAWLRKLRPWWGHEAHFHVRLRCPAGQTDCVNQAPPPPGDGCDASLAWWFSEAAKRPARPAPEPGPPTPLPAGCEAILLQP